MIIEGRYSKCEQIATINHFVRVTFNSRPPIVYCGHTIVCTDTDIYLFARYSPSKYRNLNANTFLELWRYNFFSKTWCFLSRDIPRDAESGAVLLHGNYLVTYGDNCVPLGERIRNKLYSCDLRGTNGIISFREIVTSGDAPVGLYGHCICQDEHYLYVLGGTCGYLFYLDVYRLDLKTKVWECVYMQGNSDDRLYRSYKHKVAVYEGNIYVFGGCITYPREYIFGFEKIPVFNIMTRTWRILNAKADSRTLMYPASRKCHGLVQHTFSKHMCYIIGGCGSIGHVYKDSWRIDLRTMQWSDMKTLYLTLGTYFHSTAITPSGKVFSYGGIEDRELPVSEISCEMYQTWIQVPFLKELCWDAIMLYNQRNIPGYRKLELINFGLPYEYACRIP